MGKWFKEVSDEPHRQISTRKTWLSAQVGGFAVHRLPVPGIRVVGIERLRFESRSALADLHGTAAGLGTDRAHTAADYSTATGASSASAGGCRAASYDVANAGTAPDAAGHAAAAVGDDVFGEYVRAVERN
jgi:hypothetical protein